MRRTRLGIGIRGMRMERALRPTDIVLGSRHLRGVENMATKLSMDDEIDVDGVPTKMRLFVWGIDPIGDPDQKTLIM
jgi:hypothetical protein